ncbi:hypothetical protein HOE425_320052 [Hoeflea sp. EC-HK425]|nr:hypothetical protein HOE425_320052 [Hoeflea sp. EC-HK425]
MAGFVIRSCDIAANRADTRPLMRTTHPDRQTDGRYPARITPVKRRQGIPAMPPVAGENDHPILHRPYLADDHTCRGAHTVPMEGACEKDFP